MYDKINTFTRIKSNETVKQTECHNCFKYWQMLQHVIPHLRYHTLLKYMRVMDPQHDSQLLLFTRV